MWQHNVLTLLSHFSTLQAKKSDNKVKTFHLSKINNISCTFTPSTIRKINKNIRNAVYWNAAYFVLIYCNNLLWQFVGTFCSGILLSQFLWFASRSGWRKRKPFLHFHAVSGKYFAKSNNMLGLIPLGKSWICHGCESTSTRCISTCDKNGKLYLEQSFAY